MRVISFAGVDILPSGLAFPAVLHLQQALDKARSLLHHVYYVQALLARDRHDNREYFLCSTSRG